MLREHNTIAVAVLLFIEELGIPLPFPGNIVLMYIGMLAGGHHIAMQPPFAAGWLATSAGSMGLYAIGALLGRPLLLKWGYFLGLDRKRVERIERWLSRYGLVAVFIGRCLPGARTPTSAVAGMFRIDLLRFSVVTSLSSFLWVGFWLELGAIVGRRFDFEAYLSGEHGVMALVVMGLFIMVLPAAGIISGVRERRRCRDYTEPDQPKSGELETARAEPARSRAGDLSRQQ